MRVFLAIGILLLLPTAAAGELVWHVPGSGAAGQLVNAAYTIEEGDGLQGHVNVQIQAWLDDVLLATTDYVHEHDGAYTLSLMPPAEGTLRLVATRDDGASEATIPIAARPTGGHVEAEIKWVTGDIHVVPSSATTLIDVPSTGGDLLVSTWGRSARVDTYGAAGAIAWVSGTGDQHGAAMVEIEAGSGVDAIANIAIPTGSAAPCGNALVLDPGPTGAAYSWQQGVNVRATHLLEGPTTYQLKSVGDGLPPGMRTEPSFTVTSDGPLSAITFSPGNPGPHHLLVTHGTTYCSVAFTVTPPPEADSGVLEAELGGTPGALDIHFAPLAADGSKLGHYEFDTRVIRHADDGPGHIAWIGKLHGHAGDVRLQLGGLPSGNYTVVTYPSPQGASTPSLAGDGLFRFDIYVPAQDLGSGDGQEKSTPGIGVLALLALAFVARRR